MNDDRKTGAEALIEACKIVGSVRKLSAACGINTANISAARRGNRPIPPAWCLKIEAATKRKIKAADLRPDFFVVKKPEKQ